MSLVINFSGKVALITGASQGIGAQIARTFHAAGATVVLNHPGLGDTGADAAALAEELNVARPKSADVIAANVVTPAAVQEMMSQIQARHGGLDFLINNAAIIRDRTMAKMSLEEWDAVVDVNLSGVFYCCKYALEILREHKPDRPLDTNVEFYTALLLEALGLPPASFTCVFAMGRVAGWIAHAREQLAGGRLIRPRSVYVGPEPRIAA